MVKAEVKTPNKRKSIANDTPAKKLKVENGKTSEKPFTPKKQVFSPKNNQQASGKKFNKNNKQTNSDSPKELKPFAGTKQLKQGQQPKKEFRPKPGANQKSQESKKRRKNQFSNLIVEVKAKEGSKDAETIQKLNEKIEAITSRGEITKTARKELSILKKLKTICEEGAEVAAAKSRALVDAAKAKKTAASKISDTSSVPSASEKKLLKRKVSSLSADESFGKKVPGKVSRKNVSASESKEDISDEPARRKPRRKSNTSTGSVGSKKSSDNVKAETKLLINEQPEESGLEDTTTASETERFQKDIAMIEQAPNKEQILMKKNEEVEAIGTPKEPEFVEIKINADITMQMEEEPSEVPEKTTGKLAVKVEIATEPLLKYNILYAEHVRKFLSLYKDKPVETREASKDEVLAVKLPSGTICGVKLHKDWPLTHKSEAERAFYDEKVAKLALEVRDLLCLDEKTLKEANLDIIPDIEMTMEDLKKISYARDIELQRKRSDRLKKEADLLTWESKFRKNLLVKKAFPDAAIETLKEFSKIEKDLDALMFKKHPDVVNSVRRLRRYYGKVEEWDMSNQDLENFTKKAEIIRNEAEKIFNKIKNVVNIKEEKGTFWDSFKDLVADFKTKCKNLSEDEVLDLCAEPDSRQAFFDKLDKVTESEISDTSSVPSASEKKLLKTKVSSLSADESFGKKVPGKVSRKNVSTSESKVATRQSKRLLEKNTTSYKSTRQENENVDKSSGLSVDMIQAQSSPIKNNEPEARKSPDDFEALFADAVNPKMRNKSPDFDLIEVQHSPILKGNKSKEPVTRKSPDPFDFLATAVNKSNFTKVKNTTTKGNRTKKLLKPGSFSYLDEIEDTSSISESQVIKNTIKQPIILLERLNIVEKDTESSQSEIEWAPELTRENVEYNDLFVTLKKMEEGHRLSVQSDMSGFIQKKRAKRIRSRFMYKEAFDLMKFIITLTERHDPDSLRKLRILVDFIDGIQ